LTSSWDLPCAGVKDEYYLYYFGFNQPRYRHFNHEAGISYRVEVIDTWNMTIMQVPGTFEGAFRVEMPGRQYMAVRLTVC
ncbi:DUF5605 domain-containing protein, partial [Lysinibacillus sp. GbtcB16]|uniref:DUF5605 domain-containing protein n=1 Tax=Lysinibacillus sp. GbtcB16 TaxID=2824761 RepID=UPI001C30E2D1